MKIDVRRYVWGREGRSGYSENAVIGLRCVMMLGS